MPVQDPATSQIVSIYGIPYLIPYNQDTTILVLTTGGLTTVLIGAEAEAAGPVFADEVIWVKSQSGRIVGSLGPAGDTLARIISSIIAPSPGDTGTPVTTTPPAIAPAAPSFYLGPPAGYDPAGYTSVTEFGASYIVPVSTHVLFLMNAQGTHVLIGPDADTTVVNLGPGETFSGFWRFISASNSTPTVYPTAPPITGLIVIGSPLACFAAGTLISIEGEQRAVESLVEGDLVTSPWGETLPVIWLGHRRVDCARHPSPKDVWPVRVRAHAFGPSLPARDLRLSPDHAVFVAPEGSRGVLIPIRHLINGTSVVQEHVDEVTYWHVELPRHAILFAEGLPAESYLDTGNRGAFIEADGATMLHADFAAGIWNAHACAPHVSTGPLLDAIRARLAAMLPFLDDGVQPGQSDAVESECRSYGVAGQR
jgi:hypothetical protein